MNSRSKISLRRKTQPLLCSRVRQSWKLIFIPVIGTLRLSSMFVIDILRVTGTYKLYTPKKRNQIYRFFHGLGSVVVFFASICMLILIQPLQYGDWIYLVVFAVYIFIGSIFGGVTILFLDRWFATDKAWYEENAFVFEEEKNKR